MHSILFRMAKTEGYNENYFPGRLFERGPCLLHAEVIFHYELKRSVATHVSQSRNKQIKTENTVLILIPLYLTCLLWE